MGILDIVYVILWAVLAVYCIFSAHKIHKILYLAGAFFTLLFGWNLADLLLAADLQAGIAGWIFRGIAVVFLIVFLVIYLKIRKNPEE